VRELSLHILDVIENAVEAGASRIRVEINEDPESDRLTIGIDDNGKGMGPDLIREVLNPFCTTRKTRHVGLGLPLFSEAARRCDGALTIDSAPGKGTRVRVTFRHSHIDRAPLGDVPSALLAVLLSERPVDIHYLHRVGKREFLFDTAEVREALDGISLAHPKVRDWIFQQLQEGEENLHSQETQSGS